MNILDVGYFNVRAAATAFAIACFVLPSAQLALAEEAETVDDDQTEEIVVTGIRGSLRASADYKRAADNVADFLVAEDIGKFPDQNLAEAIQRIPGVAISRMRGEGATISVRGLGPAFLSVLVNGRTALSGGTQSFAGNIGDHSQTRKFRFESMQAELVQQAEVYKSTQANMLESGLAGTINIRTRRPFDNGGKRIVAANAMVTSDELSEENGVRWSGVYSDSNADKTLGVLVSLAGDDRSTREDWINVVDYDLKVFNNAVGADGNPLPPCTVRDVGAAGCGYAPRNIRSGLLTEEVERLNGNIAVQWMPNERTDVNFDYVRSWINRDHDDYQLPLRSQAGLANGATEVHVNEDNIVTYFRTAAARPRPFPRPRIEESTSDQIGLNVNFSQSDQLTLIFDFSHSTAHRHRFHYESYYDVPKVPVSFDIRNSYIPVINIEQDLLDPSVYKFNYYGEGNNNADDEETQFRFDVVYDFYDGAEIHAGVSFRTRTRFWEERSVKTGPRYKMWNDPVAYLTDVEYGELPFNNLNSGIDNAGSWPNAWLLPNIHSVRQTYFVDRRDEIPQATLDGGRSGADGTVDSEDFTQDEDLTDLYFMAKLSGELGDVPWTGNVGARWVRLERAATGFVQPVDEMVYLETEIWDMVVGAAEFQTHHVSFAELLPSMNLKFNLRDDLIARFAWGKVMSQPSFDHLNPGGQKHAGQKLVTEGDPTLLPYIAEQVDIGIEWYPSEDAFFSVHAFAMEVESFIIEKSRYEDWIEPNGSTLFDPESGGNLRLLYSGPINGDGATIAGMEFSAHYSFASLPEPLDGLGVQLNHTWITTDGEFANPSSGAKFGVPGLSEGTTNLVAFYEKGRISGRIAWNKRSEFLVGVESTVGQSPEFTMPYWQIDAGFSFDITDNLKFVFEGINLTDNNVDLFVRVGPTSRMPQLFLASNSGRRWQTGIRYRL